MSPSSSHGFPRFAGRRRIAKSLPSFSRNQRCDSAPASTGGISRGPCGPRHLTLLRNGALRQLLWLNETSLVHVGHASQRLHDCGRKPPPIGGRRFLLARATLARQNALPPLYEEQNIVPQDGWQLTEPLDDIEIENAHVTRMAAEARGRQCDDRYHRVYAREEQGLVSSNIREGWIARHEMLEVRPRTHDAMGGRGGASAAPIHPTPRCCITSPRDRIARARPGPLRKRRQFGAMAIECRPNLITIHARVQTNAAQ